MARKRVQNGSKTPPQLRRQCEKLINWYLKKVGLLPLVVCTSGGGQWRFSSVLLRPTKEDEARKRTRKLCKLIVEFTKNEAMEKLA